MSQDNEFEPYEAPEGTPADALETPSAEGKEQATSSEDEAESLSHSDYLPNENSHLGRMYRSWFLDYASYVILERAVPHIDDGLKPVQRRILHCMHQVASRKLIKVSNIVGETMKYHPHGDASINDALVQLGQKGYLIDTQGNWGNIYTGDSAAAGRYIEAKLSHFALEALFGDSITTWHKSYDGSLDEPTALPVRFPILLAQGAEGIAVGLSSKILPHNFVEICQASIAHLRGESFALYPDFPTGGLLDVARYNDGERGGSIRSRARIEKLDSNTLSITELPAGKTTEALIDNITKAVEKGKIRIKHISDMTAATTDIRLHLASGVSSDKAVDALYSFTECELSISPNCCVIQEDKPIFTNISHLLRYSTERTKELFGKQLEQTLERKEEQRLYASLERIFIEERIYKDEAYEQAKKKEIAIAHISGRLQPFIKDFYREITDEDVARLLDIRMARASSFDLAKHEEELRKLEAEIKEIKHDLAHLTDYTIRWYEYLIDRYGELYPRKSKLTSFATIERIKVAELDSKLYLNRADGFVGTALRDGELICPCSSMDDIVLFFRSGRYMVTKVEEKKFIGKEPVIHVARYLRGDDRTIYNVVYRDGATGASYIKRFNLGGLIRDKQYDLTRGSEGSRILYFTSNSNGEAERITINLKIQNRKQRLFDFDRDFSAVPIKGKGAVGLLVTKAEISSIKLLSKGYSTLGGREVWFDRDVQRLNYNGQGEFLGEFDAKDRILVILEGGECYTTDFADTNHYEENIWRIEKLEPRKLWTAIYTDTESGYPYIKRFPIDPEQKREHITGGAGTLLLLTDNYYARLGLSREPKAEEDKLTIIEVDEFALTKSIRAKGKRLATYTPQTLTELAPLKENPYQTQDKQAEGGEAEPAESLYYDNNLDFDNQQDEA